MLLNKLVIVLSIFLSVFGLASCSSFMSENSDRAQLHLKIAVGYLESEKYPQALNELLLAKKFDANNPAIYNNLGIVYYHRQKYDLSLQSYQKALILEPQFTEARNNYAMTLIELGKHKEAEAELKKAAEDLTYASPYKIYTNLGKLYFNKKDYTAAKKYLELALQDKREDCVASTYYGRTLYEINHSASACEKLDRAAENCIKANYEEPQYYAALCFYKVGQGPQAQARLTSFVNQYPDSKFAEEAKAILTLIK